MVTPRYFAAEALSSSTLCKMYLVFKGLTFLERFRHFYLNSINYAYKNDSLSVTQKQGVNTCLPKPNKNKHFLKKRETNIVIKCSLQNDVLSYSKSFKTSFR